MNATELLLSWLFESEVELVSDCWELVNDGNDDAVEVGNDLSTLIHTRASDTPVCALVRALCYEVDWTHVAKRMIAVAE